MSWDWEKSLGDITDSLSDVLKSEYVTYKAKEAQPLLEQTYKSMVLPLVIIGFVFLLLWKKL